MKHYDVYGLGNGLVDIFLEISEEDFERLELPRGTMRLVEADEQKALLEKFEDLHPTLVSGGSVANSVIACAQLGGKSAFACSLGDDNYGLYYKSEFDNLGIELGTPLRVGATTGTSIILVTPDAERTMRTCLAAASELGPEGMHPQIIEQSKWLFIEGYVFSNSNTGQKGIERAIELAKASDCRIAITFSEAWVIESFGDAVRSAVAQADLVFANEVEACAFTGQKNAAESFAALKDTVPNSVVTAGPEDLRVHYDGEEFIVPTFATDPVDLTGAGDMLAGAFLYGITNGCTAPEAAQGACFLAHEVISQVGARLHSEVQELWQQGMSARG